MYSTCSLDIILTKINYKSLRKYKVGIYIKFHHMLRGKIFEINDKIKIGGQICPPPLVLIGLKQQRHSYTHTLFLIRMKVNGPQ